ncbi:GTP-binding protein HflX [bacterium SM23_57]|nr:MAG: GTP-binding protein HflX [bacterium SM23_57]
MADQKERVLLIALRRKGVSDWEVDDHLDELAQLADTAGAQVMGRFTQRLAKPDPATFLGKGKVRELVGEVRNRSVNSVVFDDDLAPAQVRNLEKELDVKVLDRSGVILDIFARRARSREARTQVELAQLNYLLPRLTRRWGHLSRQIGGIGVRGPGETQLEVDKRLVRERIAKLSKELVKIEKGRQVRRRRRESMFRAAIVGYTNAGKSTLLNALTGAEAFVEDRLFATLDSTTRKLALTPQTSILLTDTVGFIRKLPHHLVASFRSTLEETVQADLLMHVIDISHPQFRTQMKTVKSVLRELGLEERPRLFVFNKVDQLQEGAALEWARKSYPNAVFISALLGIRISHLVQRLSDIVLQEYVEGDLAIPIDKGDLVAKLYQLAEVLDIDQRDGALHIRFRTHQATLDHVLSLIGSGNTTKP